MPTSISLPLASFNYEAPSPVVVAIAILIGLFAVGFISVTMRPLRAFFCGGVASALITGYAAGSGGGDMVGFNVIFFGAFAGVAGALVSTVAATVIRQTRNKK